MRKLFTLFFVVMASVLCMTAGELKIGVNDASQKSAPVYGLDADRYQYHTQTIYAASELTALVGQQITQITFFQKSTTSAAFANVQISLLEVSESEFAYSADFISTATAQVVYTGSLPNSTTMAITLSEPYMYNGGNLLIDFQKTQPSGGGYGTSGWKGFQATAGITYTVLYDKGTASGMNDSGTASTNRPDVLFTYTEASAVVCAAISSISASNVTASEATLTWESDAENFQFVYTEQGGEPSWDGVEPKAVKTVGLENLKSNTSYDFYVRSYCSETEQGTTKKISFKTDLSCYAPTLLAVPEAQITSENAVVTWHASGKGETQYQYTYGAYGSTPNWENAPLTAELSATLTGLAAASLYQVWVRSYCAADDQSEALTEYFATPCGAVALPFNEDFSSDIDCWTQKDLTGYSGINSNGQFLFAWAATPPYQTIITPALIASDKEVSVSFQYKAHSSTYPESFKVGYSTTTNDLTTAFTWGDEVQTALTKFETYFAILPAGVKYVAIQCTSNNQYYLYIDDFSVAEYEAPACPVPADLKVTSVAAKTATIAWTSEASAWNYQLSKDGANWDDAKAATSNPFELTALNANTLYYVRVQAACGEDGVSDWTDAVSFQTECGALSLPYSEGFEEAESNQLPNCWESLSTDGFPVVFADNFYDTRAYAGNQSLKFYGYEIDQIAILPELEKEISTAALSFWYTATDDAEAPAPTVGYITDLSNAASYVAVKTLTFSGEYVQANISFENAPAGARMAIRYQGGDWFGSFYVDELQITENTGNPTAIDNTPAANKAVKRVINGQVVILKNGLRYNILGTVLEE